jgi:hypothetical protein
MGCADKLRITVDPYSEAAGVYTGFWIEVLLKDPFPPDQFKDA